MKNDDRSRHLRYFYNGRRKGLSTVHLVGLGLCISALQIFSNIFLYLHQVRPEPDPDPSLYKRLEDLNHEIDQFQYHHDYNASYQHDARFFPFTIRDAKRLSPVQIPPEFHIFDYLDTTVGNQQTSKRTQLWVDARFVAPSPCHIYSILCYKRKILQTFDYLLSNTTAQYFFFMEADNELCVPMNRIRNLVYRHEKYFIGTGIGFSGWIMNRTFVEDFLEAYRPPHKNNNESPDPIGARLLMEKKAWTVTREYFVSHTITQGLGALALTVGKVDKKSGEVKDVKHLPRCLEPKRTKWLEMSNSTEDMHGWDFFDSDDCPADAELYPCRPDQYVNVSYGVKDTFKVLKNKTQNG